jgi:hypothetical protein
MASGAAVPGPNGARLTHLKPLLARSQLCAHDEALLSMNGFAAS